MATTGQTANGGTEWNANHGRQVDYYFDSYNVARCDCCDEPIHGTDDDPWESSDDC